MRPVCHTLTSYLNIDEIMSISFCITSYSQDCHLIINLLNELTNQTFGPDEIIFYCSGIDNYIGIPKTIKINNISVPINTIYSSKLTNQATARNICAKISNYQYIIFFDIDDIPHPNKIEITREVISATNVDFVLHNYNKTYHKSEIFEQISKPIKTYAVTEIDPNSTNIICANHDIHHAHIAVNKKVFNTIQFNESSEYYRKEDGKFCQDLINLGYSGLYLPYKLVDYIT